MPLTARMYNIQQDQEQYRMQTLQCHHHYRVHFKNSLTLQVIGIFLNFKPKQTSQQSLSHIICQTVLLSENYYYVRNEYRMS